MTGFHTRYIDLRLVPSQGDPLLLLQHEDFSSETSISQVRVRLPSGDYEIALTSLKSPGILKEYFLLP